MDRSHTTITEIILKIYKLRLQWPQCVDHGRAPEALGHGRGFPAGLFWFKRGQDEPYPAVTQLIDRAGELGIDAHLVEAESFDELFSDLLRYLPQTAEKIAALTGAPRPWLAKAAPRASTGTVPAIRMNALAVTSRPALCRIVDCTIGGDKEIEEAVAKAGVDIIAHRTRDGVLAFGRDADVRTAFEPFGIKTFDPPCRTSGFSRRAASVLSSAMRSSVRSPSVLGSRSSGNTAASGSGPSRDRCSLPCTDTAKPVDRLAGLVPKTDVPWSEACDLRVDYRLDQFWLLIRPIVVTDLPPDAPEDVIEIAREFVRERRARRLMPSGSASGVARTFRSPRAPSSCRQSRPAALPRWKSWHAI